MATKIRKDQIRIEEFIQALASVNWSSDQLTASAKAIDARIAEKIGGVSGAMLYRGAWSTAESETEIKVGYTYVYNGSGTVPSGVTLESGDVLIANTANASISTASNWTIVNVNITGAITSGNFLSTLLSTLESGNTSALTIAQNGQKLKLTVKFPTIQNGSASEGQYISGISINATTGVISVTKGTLVDYRKRIVFDEAAVGDIDGENKVFETAQAYYTTSSFQLSLYINGVKQHKGTDFTLTQSTSTGKAVVTLASSAYIPKEGDIVTFDYLTRDDVSA